MSELTKTITIRVTPEQHKAIRVYVSGKGVTAQQYIKGLIEEDMKKAEEEVASDE